MCGAVDELLGPVARDHVAVVDDDGPDLHGDEKRQIQISLDREYEGEDALGGSVSQLMDHYCTVGLRAKDFLLVGQRLHVSI